MISVRYGIFMGVLLLIGGLSLVSLNAYTTWVQGATWAVTDNGKWIISATIMTIEIVGVVVIGFAGGAALSAKRWLLGTILTLAMIGSALVVVNSIASFQATERLSATKTHEVQIARLKDADKLQATAANRAMREAANSDTSRARRDFLKANQQSIADFRSVKTDVILEPDAGAALFAKLFGWTLERVQMTQAAYISVLQVLLAMLCFHAAGFFLNPMGWGRRAEAAKAIGTSKKEVPGGGNSDGGGSVETPGKLRVVHNAGTSSFQARLAEVAPTGRSSLQPADVPSEISIFQPPADLPSEARSPIPYDPHRVSNGGTRVQADDPRRKRKAKMPFDQMRRSVRASLVHGERTRSAREIAKETGWSHTHVLKQLEREESILERRQQKHLPLRRDPRGFGASLQH